MKLMTICFSLFWRLITLFELGGKQMNGLMNWMEKYILPTATKIGSQKHLVALRDAFIATMPATMAGAIATLLNAFLRDFPRDWGYDGFVEAMTPIIGINGFVWTGTLAIMAVIFSMTLGSNLAKAYGVDRLSGSVVSLAAFFMGLTDSAQAVLTLPKELGKEAVAIITEAGGTVAVDKGVQTITTGAWGYFNFGKHMGGSGLFTAMIFGFIATIIFAKLMQKNIIIKMPDSVPPAVSKAFAAIIPAAVALYTVGIINYTFTKVTGQRMIDWITETIQGPMINLSQGFGAVILIVFMVHLLWFFGIHGTNVMSPILQTLYGTAMTENTNAFQTGQKIPYKWVAGSFESFVWPGGAGVTLVLIISVLLLSKRADYLTVGKLSIGPGIFNINEPVMFGMPVVLNPLFMIPFILAPMATASIAYAATFAGLVKPVVVNVLWVMPTIVSGFLATGGDWRAIILTLVNLVVAFIIWAPFIIAANKMDPSLGETD